MLILKGNITTDVILLIYIDIVILQSCLMIIVYFLCITGLLNIVLSIILILKSILLNHTALEIKMLF